MAVSDVKKIYQDVINDVCSAVREALSEEGYDDHTLQELKTLWLAKLENSKALEPTEVSPVDQATTREYRHPNPGDSANPSLLNAKQAPGMRLGRLHPVSTSTVTNFTTNFAASAAHNPGLLSMASQGATQITRPGFSIRPTTQTNIGNNTMRASNQLDGSNDEFISDNSTKKYKNRKKKSKIIEISLQLDGTGPPDGDDDDEDEDSEIGNEVGEDLDEDEDEEGNEEGKEDPNPLNSGDDISDDEPAELFDTENVVVCQYDKISRTKNKWRFILKSGVMNINGRDYVFNKATGEADW